MSEHKERIKTALAECAEQGIPDTLDLWPKVREKTADKIRRSRRFVPRTRVGWVFAIFAALLFGTGAYAASSMVNELFRGALPGGEGRVIGEEIGREQTDGGARVTLEYAYADEKYVVVGYSVRDLKEDRKLDGHPSELEPVHFDDTSGNEAELPPRVDLTDGSDRDFDMVDGTTVHAGNPEDRPTPKPNVAVFAPSEDLEPGEEHSFRLKVVLAERGMSLPGENEAPSGFVEFPYDPNPDAGPFFFDLEVPVRPVPVVEVNESVEANGITLTLERVLNSPGRPQAVICFEPPDEDHEWLPWVKHTGFASDEPITPRRLGNGCWSVTLGDRAEGRTSVTVTDLMGAPLTDEASKEDEDGTEIVGPWKFDFTVPEP